ncbi:MAG: S8 family peptidase [Actinomycetaceae bacterium]|nr:S8 family peptidase [Actinomycetaceae bacterium]
MNNILQLKGQFQYNRAPRPGAVNLPSKGVINSDKLYSLIENLKEIKQYWSTQTVPFDPLISVYYKTVVAKSNRIRKLLSTNKPASASVVGAKFIGDEFNPKHVITHCVNVDTIDNSIALLKRCAEILESDYDGSMNHDKLKTLQKNGLRKTIKDISKTTFSQCLRDAFFVDRFGIENNPETIDGETLVTIYDIGYQDLISFMHDLGFTITSERILGNAMRLTPDEYKRLVNQYPYLVSMVVKDLNQIEIEQFPVESQKPATIADPTNEPTIGVIDTAFDNQVYFSSWVDTPESPYVLKPNEIEPQDKNHGTAISSLIVDGPRLNPTLDDGCGRFRVRHFGVAKASRFSSFAIMRSIRGIVRTNRDIKVWNISLGSPIGVSRNFVSPEAAILDELQSEFDDIVFIIAGTNKNRPDGSIKIGAPADSINSIVVNATTFDGSSASYSRKGPVLSFFKKPDICCVGGDSDKGMHVYTPTGDAWSSGTSFAAPWIARKMAYLMQVINLPREIAKALIIDSAAGWNFDDNPYMGYGRVPQHITNILGSSDDEIRFIITGTSEDYETYHYGIPVPINNGTHPYIARATMCYFPKCDRRQGVDYTSTEMDLHFGRINDKNQIQSLNKNPQGEQGAQLYEREARVLYRKWDNVKHIGEVLKKGNRARKSYNAGLWGIKIRTTERDDEKNGRGMNFGVVVTLKEINGVNRIDDFIHKCSLRGWIVNRVDVENRIDIYNAAEVDINFDD